jgi:AraC family transcriptional regulator, regulatory protein of adaptative response / methylated-DNA-[protein]-cysteine methyltransferase
MISVYISGFSSSKSHNSKYRIQWGISTSPYGNILIASSELGITHLSFFDVDPTDNFQQMTSDLSGKAFEQNDRFAINLAHQIFKPDPVHDFALHLDGTEFQLQVWKALLEIPRGKTCTYKQLASRLGKPIAARAVGNAVGKNRIAYLIPCHRVIREDQSLGGYRWGTTRKSEILTHERSGGTNQRLSTPRTP